MKKWKQRITAILAASVLCMSPASALAAVDLNAVYETSTDQIAGWPAGPELTSDAAVLMDAQSGILLYNKGGDELRYPASITKLMTLLVAVENASLDEQVTFTETGVRDVTWDSGNIGMQLGEVMSMEDCLYALIIQSANEVAAQIAEHVGGTEQNFIDMMNARAVEIGCTNTHFTNASGLPDENHYSTAHDMAKIMQEGLKNKTFSKIIKTPTYTIKPTNLNSESRRLHTHHPMLASETTYYYKGCIGGKTGNTNAAGSTLVTAVKRKKGTYITVTLRAPELAYAVADSTALFDYAYQNFAKTKVDGGSVLIPKGTDVNVLTVDSQENGSEKRKSYYFNNYLVGTAVVPIVTATPTPEPTKVPEADTATGSDDLQQEKAQESDAQTQTAQSEDADTQEDEGLLKILLIVMAVMLLILGVLLMALVKKNNRHK